MLYYTYSSMSACDHENNFITQISEAARSPRPLILFRRIKKNICDLSGPKTPLVACVFYLVSTCTCFWLLPFFFFFRHKFDRADLFLNAEKPG